MTDSSSSSRQQQQDTGQQQLRSDYGITQELLTGYCSAAAVARLAGGATILSCAPSAVAITSSPAQQHDESRPGFRLSTCAITCTPSEHNCPLACTKEKLYATRSASLILHQRVRSIHESQTRQPRTHITASISLRCTTAGVRRSYG
jgi:hypothetical protein